MGLFIITGANSYASIPHLPFPQEPQNTEPDSTVDNSGPLEAKVVYNASDSIRFDLQEQKVYLYGVASVEYENIKLNADHIQYGFKDNVVYAYGRTDSAGKYVDRPIFTEGQTTFEADTMYYNFETKKGVIKEVRTQEGGGYLLSEVTKKHSNDNIHVLHGKYTTCSLDHPHYYFSLSKAVVVKDKDKDGNDNSKIVAGPTHMVVADIPTPLAVPFGYFPNKKGEAAGILIPTYGESDAQGFFLQNGGYYWPINDRIDTRLTGDIYSKGSWGGRSNTRYKTRYKYDGSLDITYSVSKFGIKESNDYSESKDFFVRWTHRQDAKARPNSTFSASVNAGTNTNFSNNVNTSTADFLTNTFNSSVNYSYNFPNAPLRFNVSARHEQNTQTQTVRFNVPSGALSLNRIYPGKMLRKTFGNKKGSATQKWYEKIGVSGQTRFDNELNTYDTLLSFNNLPGLLENDLRYGVRHSLTANTSIKLFKRKAPFTLNPRISYTERWYMKTIAKRYDNDLDSAITDTISGFRRAYDYNTGATLSTKLFGFYYLKGGHIIRHTLTPNFSFTYNPSFSTQETGFFGEGGTLSTFSPFQTGIYGQPNSTESGLIGISVNNNLEMKVMTPNDSIESKKIKLLESFTFATSYDIFREVNQFNNVSMNGRTRLFKKLDINFTGVFDPYDYDTTGSRIDDSYWSADGGIGKLSSGSINTSFSLRSKDSKQGDLQSDAGTQQQLDFVNANRNDYVDFNVPWTLSMGYNFSFNRQYNSDGSDTIITVQSIGFSGDFNLTEAWKVGFSSGYDFVNKDFSYTSFNLYRDMHCWEMVFNWVPFGARQSYNIQVNVKAAMLQDLKLTRRRQWFDYQ